LSRAPRDAARPVRRWRLGALVTAAVAVAVAATIAIISMNGTTAPAIFDVTASMHGAVVGSVGCWSPSSCVAVGSIGDEGEVWFLAHGKVTSSQPVSGTVRLVSVACAGGADCVAGGRSAGSGGSLGETVPSVGAIVAIDDGGIGSAAQISSVQAVTGVACWSATSCVAVADTAKASAVVSLSSGLVMSVKPTVAADGTFESIACGAPGRCEIASFLNPTSSASSGLLISFDNGIAGPAQRVATTVGLWGVACPTVTRCLAVGLIRTQDVSDFEGVFLTVASGRPGSVVAVPGTGDLFGVSCTSTHCEAVGAKTLDKGGVATAIVGTTTGKVEADTRASYFSSVACPTAGACIAVGHVGTTSALLDQIDGAG